MYAGPGSYLLAGRVRFYTRANRTRHYSNPNAPRAIPMTATHGALL
ncbi:hypothetical protein BAURA63_02437 [Brevibacterium aurantiacum]|uniref:Uncharacterized protein n=1 Tax=Brevibacterium aurantiacum TaxID=273384 RepID=A0A2H1JN93_BREAU|nr:hypothetical protein BAURA63_02437 [Brevibacterium aurantiacum]